MPRPDDWVGPHRETRRRWSRRSWSVTGMAWALGLLVPNELRAEEEMFRLEWHTPADCFAQGRAEQKLAVLLGAKPERVVTAPMQVTVTVVHSDERLWQVELAVRQHGETRLRRLGASSCDEVGDAVALLVAFAVDPDYRSRVPAPPQTDPPEISAAAPVALPPPQASPPQPPIAPSSFVPQYVRPPNPTRVEAFVGLGPVMEFGMLPWVGLGGTLVGGAQIGHLRMEVAPKLFASAAARLPGASQGGGHFWVEAAALRSCWLVPTTTQTMLGPCAMLELGLLSGRGFGVDFPASAHKTWGSARAGLHAEFVPTPRVHFAVQGDFGLPIGRPRFLLDGTEIHRPAGVVGGGRVLVELHFR
jgi:hypothetical protein